MHFSMLDAIKTRVVYSSQFKVEWEWIIIREKRIKHLVVGIVFICAQWNRKHEHVFQLKNIESAQCIIIIMKCSWTIDGTTGDFYLLLTLFECRFLLHFSPPRFCVIFSVSTNFFFLSFAVVLLWFGVRSWHTISWRLMVTDNKINSILHFFFHIKRERKIQHEILVIINCNASNLHQ